MVDGSKRRKVENIALVGLNPGALRGSTRASYPTETTAFTDTRKTPKTDK